MRETDLFEDCQLATPSNTDTSVKDVIMSDAPDMLSPEWTDYVKTLFDESKTIDGNPLVHGLRRVAEQVLGPISFSGPTQVFPVQTEHGVGRATVVFTVRFANGLECAEVADSWEGNTDDTFCAFAVAIASTRAEARALRKALKMRGVAAEELTKKDTAKIVRQASQVTRQSDGEYDESTSGMTDNQARFLDAKCKQLNVNVKKLFGQLKVDTNRVISKKAASDAIELVNSFQQSDVADELVGYLPDWKG